MASIPKKDLMKARRVRLKAAGLTRVDCYVTPEDRQRLARYVEDRLGGETNVRRTSAKASA